MTTRNPWLRKIHVLLSRDDFRRHPIRAVLRRAAWRARWLIYPERLWLLRARDGFCLYTMRGGAGALIYYGGTSEPETADFIRCFLKPGMVFVDVGAHLGEYTLLAANLLASSGHVHAFEPNPDVYKILLKNTQMNHCRNVSVHPEAVWEGETLVDFEIYPEPSLSAVQVIDHGRPTIKVPTVTLDRYFADPVTPSPSLIKVDVEGAELQVLKGATSLLSLPPLQAPVVIFEYGPFNTRRLGYAADDTLRFLRGHDYAVYAFHRGALVCTDGSPACLEVDSTCNLVASKLPLAMPSKLRDCR